MLERCSIWAETWLSVTSTSLFLICLFKTKDKQKILLDDHLFNPYLWGTSPTLLCRSEWVKKWRGRGHLRRGVSIQERLLWPGSGGWTEEEQDYRNVYREKKGGGGSTARKTEISSFTLVLAVPAGSDSPFRLLISRWQTTDSSQELWSESSRAQRLR